MNEFQDLSALRDIGLGHEVVQGARHAVELTNNQYAAGVVSYLNVITAQATALNNERAAVNLAGQRLTASVGLIRALGGGWSAAELPRP